MENRLSDIHSPADLKKYSVDQLPELCDEIRETLVETVSQTGGHLASNLGVVELTVALHYVLDCPRDAIVFDVGHQCYTHKLLTGRTAQFDTLRQENGLSGFPNRAESECDFFNTGHSSTAIAAALGLAQARKLQDKPGCVTAVVGDGALTGGLAYEGLNNAGQFHGNLVVILNDNKMSINRNVGAMARYLAVMRTRKGYRRVKSDVESFLLRIPLVGKPMRDWFSHLKGALKNIIYPNIFEDMGFHYIGPLDGHDLPTLIRALEFAKNEPYPILIHVCTQKGKGYSFAEKNPRAFHGIGGFDIETGEKKLSEQSFSEVFGQKLCQLAQADSRICAITAAMKSGTGLTDFATRFPSRFFDVGIAEEGAVTFASGLAVGGMIPVFAVYSTFLQRAYDQLLHDVAMQQIKVVLAVDRAGFVGDDGPSHQGLFDCAFLSSIPGMTIYAPTDYPELEDMLERAIYEGTGLCAVRYPRGLAPQTRLLGGHGKSDFVWNHLDSPVAVVSYGREFAEAADAALRLAQSDMGVSLIKLNRVFPIPQQAVQCLLQCSRVYFFEEGIACGGIGEHFEAELLRSGFKGTFRLQAVTDGFVKQADVRRQKEWNGLDSDSIVRLIREEVQNEQ